MLFVSWLRRLCNSLQAPGKRRLAQRHPSNIVRPCVEVLEDRRLLSAGALDPTFGNGAGYVTTSLTNSSDIAYTALIQPDGKVLAMGEASVVGGNTQIGMVRYNQDGSLDSSFGTGGEAFAPYTGGAPNAALYPTTGTANDGKVVITGFTHFSFSVARYNSSGTIDTSFGTNGIATANFGSTLGTFGTSMAVIQPDGKIVAVGASHDTSAPSVGTYVEMARFNSNGSLDTTFGPGGLVTTSPDGDKVFGVLTGVFLQSNGGLVVTLQGSGQAPGLGPNHWDLVGYHADGTLNTSFGTGGIVQTPPAGANGDNLSGTALYPTEGTVNDGKIVMVGITTGTGTSDPTPWTVRRYNSNGTLDSTFGNGGTVFNGGGLGYAYSVAIQPDGKVVVTGKTNGIQQPQETQAEVRYNTDGSLDSTFGTGGIVTTAIGTGGNRGDSVVLQPNGDIVVAGSAIIGSKYDFTVARYLGQATSPFYVITGPSSLTAGTTGTFTISILNPDGSADTGYSGTVHITSSDPQAMLPANFTISGGTASFSATLKSAGVQLLTATDTTTFSINGGASIQVAPGAATHFSISGPSSVNRGSAFSITVTALDAYGNVATGYTGTVHFTSSDSSATLPANYTFTAANAGVHTFTSLKLRTRGTQTITITDTLNSVLVGALSISVS